MVPSGVGASRLRDGTAAAEAAVRTAVGEAEGEASAVILFSTTAHGDPRRLVAAAEAEAAGAPVVGCAASGVLTGAEEIEDGPGVVALALGRDVPARPFTGLDGDKLTRAARSAAGGVERGIGAVFADGYSAHPERVADAVAAALPAGVSLVGGLAVGPAGAAPAYRWAAGELASRGAAGLVIGGDAVVGVAQGCRPIGRALTVTAAHGNVIEALDGRPAFEAFAEVGRPLLADLPRAAQSIFLAVPGAGLAAPPDDPVDDGFVVRGLLRFDPERGLLCASEPVAVGTRVRFALRDGYAARQDLQRMAGDVKRRLAGRRARFGLYFNCAGRGRDLYQIEDHDVAYLEATLGGFPLVGLFGGGELAPLAGRPRLQLFAGVLAVVAES